MKGCRFQIYLKEPIPDGTMHEGKTIRAYSADVECGSRATMINVETMHGVELWIPVVNIVAVEKL